MSFCTQGLPGVAESAVLKSEGKSSPSGEGVRVRAGRDGEKELFYGPHPSSVTVPLSRRARDILRNDE